MTLAIEAPGSVAEALALLAREPDRLILAGGTEVVPALTAGLLAPRPVLALGRLSELDGAGRTADGGLFIGARLTLDRVAQLGALIPVLARAAEFGPPGVRSAATVAGNVLADGDLAVVLIALDAAVETDSVNGRRSVPMAQFVADRSGSRLRAGELVVGVSLPSVEVVAGVERLVLPGHGTRSVLTVALARTAGGLRVALCGGDGVARRVPAAEELSGSIGEPATLARFAAAVGQAASDGDYYLRHAAAVCARRLARGLAEARP